MARREANLSFATHPLNDRTGRFDPADDLDGLAREDRRSVEVADVRRREVALAFGCVIVEPLVVIVPPFRTGFGAPDR